MLRQGDHRPLSEGRSATIPLAAPRPAAGRLRHQRGDEAHRRTGRRHPAEVLGTATFYEMFKFEPVGKYVINICSTMSCALLGRRRADAPRRATTRHQGRQHHPRWHVHARARRVPGGVHRGALPAGQLPLPISGHPCAISTPRSTNFAGVGSTARSRRTARVARVRQHIPSDRAVGAVPPDEVTAAPVWMPAPAEAQK